MIRINKENTKHLYQLQVEGGYIQVEANTITQAGAIARKLGYKVLSGNMIG